MAIDDKIKNAIADATEYAEQPALVAKKLISWFENLAKGNFDETNRDEASMRLEQVLDAIEIPNEIDEETEV